MNIRFLCVFIFLMCALATGIADAHTLHIGNKSFALSQTKYTTPSLNFMINGEHWYANTSMCELPINLNTNTKLKIKYDNKTYYVFGEEMRQYTQDYVIQDGRLIWANCNLYLQSTGTQYIDTNYIPTRNTIVVSDYQFLRPSSGNNQWQVGCGSNLNNTVRFLFGASNRYFFAGIGGYYTNLVPEDLSRHIFTLDAPNDTFLLDGAPIKQMTGTFVACNNSFWLFGRNYSAGNSYKHSSRAFHTRFYENGVLVHHFVPVPAGLQIGEYTVPENGMWDIVEQKFYGNSGSGSFIYGKDE